MKTLLASRLTTADGKDGCWWVAAAVCGALVGVVFLVTRHLPLMDFPLHQLEFAIWVDLTGSGARFAEHYQNQSYWLPYWATYFLARPFVPLLGVEAASRVPVAIYALGLPLGGGLLARAARRSGWWGLFLVPFVIEVNLLFGFIAYCFGGLLLQIELALLLFAERSTTPARYIAGIAPLAVAIGWTHPQIAAISIASAAFLLVLGRSASLKRKAALLLACALAAVPSLLWFLQPKQAEIAFHGAPMFAGLRDLVSRLPVYSIDAFPGRVEEALVLAVLVIVAILWVISRSRVALSSLRLPVLAVLFLSLYFVAPWDWNGQMIGQRFPFLALLCLPALPPPDVHPSRALRLLLVAMALVGAINIGLAVRGFNGEIAGDLDAVAEAVPRGSRLAYIAYDTGSDFVNAEVYLHAGAWITLRRGGVYAFHFERLINRYIEAVPRDQTMMGREFLFSRSLSQTGEYGMLKREQLSYWNTMLVRWPAAGRPVLPVNARPEEVESFVRVGRWGLFQLRRQAP